MNHIEYGNKDIPLKPCPFCGSSVDITEDKAKIDSINIERILTNIHKDRFRPFERNNLSRREEREIRHEYRIPGTDSPRFQGQGQGIRPIGASQAMLDSHIGCQFFLKLPYLRPHDECAGCRDLKYRFVNVLFQDTVLFL